MRYEFLISGRLSKTTRAAFCDFTVVDGLVGGTVVYGAIRDAAALRAVLNRFEELGLTVVEMRRLPDS